MRPLTMLPFSAQERDIDLLLLKQFHIDPGLVAWVAAQAGVGLAEFISARHSVYRGNGETDVMLMVRSGADRVAIMIEDKIGAPMQPEQAERYHIRGQELVARGEAERFRTALCAPEAYLADVPADAPWHLRLSFEAIAVRLSADPSADSLWRQAVLRLSGEKVRRARAAEAKGDPVADSTLVALKLDYRAFAAKTHPQFAISEQRGRDREIFIAGKGLPKGVRFKHALFHGQVSLIFEARNVEAAARLLADLPEGAWSERFGRELHIRSAVEPLDPALPLAEQAGAVMLALERLEMLLGLVRRLDLAA